jgi:ribosome biogenesis GTPase
MKAKKFLGQQIVPGDRVKVFPGADLGRIEGVEERRSVIRRTADDTDPREKIIAANCTHLACIFSTTTPKPQPDFIRRVLKSAEFEGVEPLLIVTKTDLEPFGASVLPPEAEGVQMFDANEEFDRLINYLQGKITAFVGLSGVGKSTLINHIFPEAEQRVGDVSANGDGRHTSTSSHAFRLSPSALVIDTPGVRSFGLGHLGVDVAQRSE